MWHMWWLAAAVVLVIAEIMSGSLYLLTVALGAAAGGLASWIGQPVWVQLVAASVFTLIGAFYVQRRHQAGPHVKASHNPDVLLDVGSRVQILSWDASNRARVQYRGAEWDALLLGGAATPGWFVIKSIEGNCLNVKHE
jgi:membrane protein implicated in regulation of membrane protease activity